MPKFPDSLWSELLIQKCESDLKTLKRLQLNRNSLESRNCGEWSLNVELNDNLSRRTMILSSFRNDNQTKIINYDSIGLNLKSSLFWSDLIQPCSENDPKSINRFSLLKSSFQRERKYNIRCRRSQNFVIILLIHLCEPKNDSLGITGVNKPNFSMVEPQKRGHLILYLLTRLLEFPSDKRFQSFFSWIFWLRKKINSAQKMSETDKVLLHISNRTLKFKCSISECSICVYFFIKANVITRQWIFIWKKSEISNNTEK